MPLETLMNADSLAKVVPTSEKVMNLIDTVKNMSGEELTSTVLSGVIEYGGKILLAILVYVIGKWLIRKFTKFLRRIFEFRKTDASITKFTTSLISITLTTFLLLSVIGILGINTTSFLAIFASAGLAIGMALSGTLQNFAGGVMILTLRPYQIGDFIEAQGYTGTVKEISLFSTLLNTVDNKMVIIPNGGLSTGIINNYSKESTRRVDWTFGVAYGSDYEKVKAVILDIIEKDERVLEDREVFVGLGELADSSVNFTVRAWTKSEHYWDLFFYVNETIYKRFNAEGIEFPFPQMEVHLNKKD